jgi:hypothetical protein
MFKAFPPSESTSKPAAFGLARSASVKYNFTVLFGMCVCFYPSNDYFEMKVSVALFFYIFRRFLCARCWFGLRPSWCRQYVPPKCRWVSVELLGVTFPEDGTLYSHSYENFKANYTFMSLDKTGIYAWPQKGALQLGCWMLYRWFSMPLVLKLINADLLVR